MSSAPRPARSVEIVSRRRAHDGFFKLDVLELRHALFAGGTSRVLHRELFVQHDAVAVLPFDPDTGRVMLVEQFRTGLIDRQDESPWLLEICAGLIDLGESLEDAARRELMEECGLTATSLRQVGAYHPSPGGTSERTTVFIATCNLPERGGLHGHAAEGEDIRTHVIGVEEALAMVRDGRIRAASAMIAILRLELDLAAPQD